jgi:hypothetical protein
MSDPMALPWSVDQHGLGIWCASLKGGETKIIDIRGWGYLTGQGHGALGLSGTEAMAIQKSIAERVVRAVNDEAELRARIQTLEAENARLGEILGVRYGGYCVSGNGCVCGGDTADIQQSCPRWRVLSTTSGEE